MEETFGKRLRSLRERKAMTRKYLAHEAGISIAYLKALEEDRPVLFPDISERLADALETTADYLLSGSNPLLQMSLDNLRAYLEEQNLPPTETNLLKAVVPEKAKNRSRSPLDAGDFKAIVENYRSHSAIAGICWRCGSGVPDEAGDRCPNCRTLWYSPDN